jgi:CRP/FNR family transcriptional regulator, cyclic AMP receptor protein
MPSQKARAEVLGQVPLFRELSRAQLAKIARVTDVREMPAGRKIVEERTYRSGGGPAFWLIVEGQADVTIRGKKVGRLKAGDSFGEISLLDGKPRSATVTARTDLVLYRILSWHFHALIRKEPSVALALLKSVAARLRSVQE